MSTDSNENYLNDPILTAYLLGELEADEHAKIEAWLKTSPEGRAQLEELQATTETLFAALQQEPRAPTPKQEISSAIQKALALPKETQQPQVSLAIAKPQPNSNAGSALLATLGTVAALIVAGVVCLQSGGSSSVATHNDQSTQRFESQVIVADEEVIANINLAALGLSEQELAEQVEVHGMSPAPIDSKNGIAERQTFSFYLPLYDGQGASTQGAPASGQSQTATPSVQPQSPQHAWPSYDNYAAVTYPSQYDASALPSVGPFYPTQQPVDGKAPGIQPQPPLGWGAQTMRWDDGAWELDFSRPTAVQGQQSPQGVTKTSDFGLTQNMSSLPGLAESKSQEARFRQAEADEQRAENDRLKWLMAQNTTDGGIKTEAIQNVTREHFNWEGPLVQKLGMKSQPKPSGPTVDSLSLLVTPAIVISEVEEKLIEELQRPAIASGEQAGKPTHRVRAYPYYTTKSGELTADLDDVVQLDTDQWLARNNVTPDRLHRQRRLQETRLSLAQQEAYAPILENEFVSPEDQPYSTFSIDVDTGSYANVRRFLHNNQMPPTNAVRLEELINSFDYEMKQPNDEHPVAVTLDSTVCPWDRSHQLVRVGIKAREIDVENRPATSLVFLIDVSGSMKDANKLPLAQAALRLLVEQMREDDRIAIVTYASNATIALESTDGSQKDLILEKIDSLGANGSTNGEGGMQLAYQVAAKNLIEEGANRILVCTDGDFNVGTSDDDGVFKLIEEHRKTGVFLSVLGFGTGNLKDSKLEGIANRGNGHYSYIDRLAEAQNVLVEHLTGTLYTVAKDVKLQLEFNPTKVESYRLLGYENRVLAAKDFNNDKVDAGEMGAGHTVTALYELAIIGAQSKPEPGVDAPRYQKKSELKPEEKPAEETQPAEKVVHGEELLFVKLRYKQPKSDESTKLEIPLLLDEKQPVSNDLQWAANVASFGMLLRDSKFKGDATWDSLLKQTHNTLKDHSTPERMEFVDLVLRGRGMWNLKHGKQSPPPKELLSLEARKKATCEDRYQELLDKFERPADSAFYGDFFEFGLRDGEKFLGKAGVPDGHWVYVYPNWYVWGEQKEE